MNDEQTARRLRERLDDELSGLAADPEALERIRNAARTANGARGRGGRGGVGRPVRFGLPPWLAVAAVVAALAVAVPVVRAVAVGGSGAVVQGVASASPSGQARSKPGETALETYTPGPSPSVQPYSSPSSEPYSSVPFGAVARCDGPTLHVSVGASNGAAGTIYYPVVFRNDGDRCYLNGFPGAAAADSGGTVTVDAVRDRSAPGEMVILLKGTSAHAVLEVSDVPGTSGPCPTYPTLLVTAPDSRVTTPLRLSLTVCAMRITGMQTGAGS
jgi:hypothetical protein